MTKVRTTHPRYVPPLVQGLAVAAFFVGGFAILLLLTRMWEHIA